jgi:hypothetical protein
MQRKADKITAPTIPHFRWIRKQLAAELARRRNLAPIAATKNKVLNGAPTKESTMDCKPAVQVSEVPGIDLDYRPRDYFWAAGLKIPLLSGIAGDPQAIGSQSH